MKTTRLLALAVIILIYGTMNFYIGKRLWGLTSSVLSPEYRTLFWSLFWLVAFSYFAGRAAGGYLPSRLASFLTVTGSYWLAAMFYLFLLLGVGDTIYVVGSYAGILSSTQAKANLASSTAVLLTLAIIGYGVWNAHNPRVTHYRVVINNKKSPYRPAAHRHGIRRSPGNHSRPQEAFPSGN